MSYFDCLLDRFFFFYKISTGKKVLVSTGKDKFNFVLKNNFRYLFEIYIPYRYSLKDIYEKNVKVTLKNKIKNIFTFLRVIIYLICLPTFDDK